MKAKKTIFSLMAVASIAVLAISCKSSNPDPEPEPDAKTTYFISANNLEGGNAAATYILSAPSLTEGKVSIVGNGFPLTNAGHVWYNVSPSTAVGFVYVRGAQNFGDVVSIKNGQVTPVGEGFVFPTRFNAYGVANQKALASTGGQIDAAKKEVYEYVYTVQGLDGVPVAARKDILVSNLDNQGEYFSFSGFTASANKKIFTGLVPSKIEYESTGGGSAVGPTDYPNNVWVARLDENASKIEKIYKDDRLSYASGRRRSQNLQHVFAEGNYVYVFSGSAEETTTKTPGALRINLSTDDFDRTWSLDLGTSKTDGHYFWRVLPVGNGYYLLDFYTKAGSKSFNDGTGKWGLVNVNTGNFTWVKGLPAAEVILQNGNIYPGMHHVENGKAYVAIMTTDGQLPAIYEIDPVTATAKRGLEVETQYITGFGKLTQE